MNNFKRSKNLFLTTFVITLLHVAAASQVPSIAGTWVSYDNNGVLARGLITIEQTGSNLTVTTPDKFKTTSVINNNTFVRLGNTGVVSSDGSRIDWIGPRGTISSYWLTKSASDKVGAAKKAAAIASADAVTKKSFADLSDPFVGKWEMYDASGTKFPKTAEITASGLTLTIDNGYGSRDTAQAGGSTFASSNGLTGTLSADRNTITWSNNFKWKRLIQNTNTSVPASNTNTNPVTAPPVAARALSVADETLVMEWIATQVAALQVPYCYKQTYGNGGPTPTYGKNECSSVKNPLQRTACYKPCPPGSDDEYGSGYCTEKCPPPFKMIGGHCNKNATEKLNGAGYPWQFGDPAFDYSKAKGRCEKDSGAGNCETDAVGVVWYPKCPTGYHKVGCCICSADCPKGWTDRGGLL